MAAIELNSVEELKNCGPGTYIVPYGHFRFKVTIGNIDENASINLDGYGVGRVKDDVVLNSYLNENQNDNTVNIVMGYEDGRNGYDSPRWQENAGFFMRDVSSTLHIKRDNSLLIGFSNSAERTVPFAADYAANNNAGHFPVVIVESSCSPPTKLSEAQRQSLINHDVTIFNVYQSHKQSRSLINPLHLQNYEGVHIIDVEVNIKNCNADLHVLPYDVFVSSGGLKLGNGNFNFNNLASRFTYKRNNSPYYNQTFDLSYRFVEHYVDENGKYVSRNISAAEANSFLKQGISSFSNYLSTSDGFVIKAVESPIKSKYQFLKDINTDSKITSRNGSAISSDYDYVSNAMNNLKKQIKSSFFIDGTKNFEFRAGDGIASMIQKYVNMYYDVVGSFMNSLVMEADAVISYGQAYVDMEADLKKGVESIGDIVEIDASSQYVDTGFNNPQMKQQTPSETVPTNATFPTSSRSTTSGYNPSSSPVSNYLENPNNSSNISSGEQKEATHQINTVEDKNIKITPVKETTESVSPQAFTQSVAEVWNPTKQEVIPTPPVSQDIKPIDFPIQNNDMEDVTTIDGMPDVLDSTYSTVQPSPVSIDTNSKGGAPVLPIVAGLSVAVATGIGAKAYIDHKKSQEEDEDSILEDDNILPEI